MTAIRICNCEHAWQDKKYGKVKRLMNSLLNGGWRCTVCGKTHKS